MKKFLAGKKDNKGFSLVELIVVILIMAIIAVALAPQVMKWVGKSAESTDDSNKATIKSAVQTALADYVAQGHEAPETVTYYVVHDGLKASGTSMVDDGNKDSVYDDVQKIIHDTMGEFPEVKTDSAKCFEIVITKSATDKMSATVVVNISTNNVKYK